MIFLLWPIVCILIGIWADKKGRNGIAYFFLSIFISPLLGGLILLIAGEKKGHSEKVRLSSGNETKCFFCAELIKKEAKLCKHCGKANHPVYHGSWIEVGPLEDSSPLNQFQIRPGDAIYKYNNVELGGSIERFISERDKATTPDIPATFVRDAEEIQVNIPKGTLGARIFEHNSQIS